MRTNELLINESHLGTRLNVAVSGARRGEFALLLALMSNDARDMAQFVGEHASQEIEQKLRSQFDMPPQQQLIAQFGKDEMVNHSDEYYRGGLTAFRLQQSLKPEAFVNRGNMDSGMREALANAEPRAKLNYLYPEEAASTLNTQVPHFAEQLTNQRQFTEIIV
ncbi:VC2046/SO_2500 family protein [Shewanella waksmanii]|uniref:VC2046/SO_2500 family protein n=1 Tax=Shewanella waksmanii TaxID=213783 RepID=UPI0037361BEA